MLHKHSTKIVSLLLSFALVFTFIAPAMAAEGSLSKPQCRIIAAGDSHSLAIDADGNLWAWGLNNSGQLGDGTFTWQKTPVKVMEDVLSVAGGSSHTLAIDKDGGLWAWGSNNSGQLGDGSTATSRREPVKVMDGIVSIAAGRDHSLAIDKNDNLWAWGRNRSGQLGDGSTTDKHEPVKVMEGVVSVVAGGVYTMAIDANGGLWAWGSNYYGQLGNGSDTDERVPVKVMENVVSVAGGSSHTLAIDANGVLWAWGYNSDGQLGDGSSHDKREPVKVMENVVSVAAGTFHSLAIDVNGNLWAWGRNWFGLGDGTTTGSYRPVQVVEGMASVAVGSSHTMAIDKNGSLWAWGNNSCGQLGDGTGTTQSNPVKLPDFVEIAADIAADLAAVAAAKAALKAVDWTVDQADENTFDGVQAWFNAILAEIGVTYGVTVRTGGGGFMAATAGTARNPTGTDGFYDSTLTIRRNNASDTYRMNLIVTATPYEPDNDDSAVAAAKLDLEAIAAWSVDQADLNTAEAAHDWVENFIAEIRTTYGVTLTVSQISFTAAVAGDADYPGGTNGTLYYTVEIKRGGVSDSVNMLLVILAIADYSDPAFAVASAKNELKWWSLHVRQADTNTAVAARAVVERFLAFLDIENKYGVALTLTPDDFMPAVIGTAENPPGVNGWFNCTVEIRKGNVIDTINMRVTITAIEYGDDEAIVDAACSALRLINWATLPPDISTSDEANAWIENFIADIAEEYGVTMAVTGEFLRFANGVYLFTVTIEKNDVSTAFTQMLSITAWVSDVEIVAQNKDALTWDAIKGLNTSKDSVTSDLILPTTGANYTTIEWTSNNSAISATGTVTRPTNGTGDKPVTLTATITRGDANDMMTFNLTVLEQSSGGGGNTTSEPAVTIEPDPTPPLSGQNPYSDVVTTDWFNEAVQFVTEEGLMEGTGGGKFSPNVTMSRAMLVTVLYRLEGTPTVNGDISFTDVGSGQWYSNAILWASQNNIVNGYSSGTFGWNDHVTREQAVTILYRYAKTRGLDVSASADLSKYTDMDNISDWAMDAMKWAVAVGIIKGRTATTTVPKGTSTRAEVAMIFKRYIKDFLGVDDDLEE